MYNAKENHNDITSSSKRMTTKKALLYQPQQPNHQSQIICVFFPLHPSMSAHDTITSSISSQRVLHPNGTHCGSRWNCRGEKKGRKSTGTRIGRKENIPIDPNENEDDEEEEEEEVEVEEKKEEKNYANNIKKKETLSKHHYQHFTQLLNICVRTRERFSSPNTEDERTQKTEENERLRGSQSMKTDDGRGSSTTMSQVPCPLQSTHTHETHHQDACRERWIEQCKRCLEKGSLHVHPPFPLQNETMEWKETERNNPHELSSFLSMSGGTSSTFNEIILRLCFLLRTGTQGRIFYAIPEMPQHKSLSESHDAHGNTHVERGGADINYSNNTSPKKEGKTPTPSASIPLSSSSPEVMTSFPVALKQLRPGQSPYREYDAYYRLEITNAREKCNYFLRVYAPPLDIYRNIILTEDMLERIHEPCYPINSFSKWEKDMTTSVGWNKGRGGTPGIQSNGEYQRKRKSRYKGVIPSSNPPSVSARTYSSLETRLSSKKRENNTHRNNTNTNTINNDNDSKGDRKNSERTHRYNTHVAGTEADGMASPIRRITSLEEEEDNNIHSDSQANTLDVDQQNENKDSENRYQHQDSVKNQYVSLGHILHSESMSSIWLALEWCPEDMWDIIQEYPEKRMPSHIVWDWFRETIEAVHVAHCAFLSHGDLKPENVLIGNDGHIRLSDWGSSVCFSYEYLKCNETISEEGAGFRRPIHHHHHQQQQQQQQEQQPVSSDDGTNHYINNCSFHPLFTNTEQTIQEGQKRSSIAGDERNTNTNTSEDMSNDWRETARPHQRKKTNTQTNTFESHIAYSPCLLKTYCTPCGSVPYMSPDALLRFPWAHFPSRESWQAINDPMQLTGIGWYPFQSDLWSIGIMLYVSISGYFPFQMACVHDPRFVAFLHATEQWEDYMEMYQSLVMEAFPLSLVTQLVVSGDYSKEPRFSWNWPGVIPDKCRMCIRDLLRVRPERRVIRTYLWNKRWETTPDTKTNERLSSSVLFGESMEKVPHSERRRGRRRRSTGSQNHLPVTTISNKKSNNNNNNNNNNNHSNQFHEQPPFLWSRDSHFLDKDISPPSYDEFSLKSGAKDDNNSKSIRGFRIPRPRQDVYSRDWEKKVNVYLNGRKRSYSAPSPS
jgi:serine/threonine protein kinase